MFQSFLKSSNINFVYFTNHKPYNVLHCHIYTCDVLSAFIIMRMNTLYGLQHMYMFIVHESKKGFFLISHFVHTNTTTQASVDH